MNVNDYFDINTFSVESSMLVNGEFRLNPDFYEALLNSNNFHQTDTFKLGEKAKISHPGITKREYIDSKKLGIPFLSTSDLQFYETVDNKYVSIETSKNLDDYIVEENTILISRSGTIGNLSLVDKNIAGFAVTEHAIRIEVNDFIYLGLVYTFLNSEIGQKIIKGQKSGAVIDEIYDVDIEQLHIPDLNEHLLDQLNNKVLQAKEKREKAFFLINKARSLVLQYNNLPTLDNAELETLDPEKETELQMVNTKEFTDDYRLDAHFHSHIFKKANENIKSFSSNYCQLNELCTDVFLCNRFKRNYVDSDNGVPLIGTKNMMQIRPSGKFIARNGIPNDVLMQKNWILLARVGSLGGTFGKVSFVWNNFEGQVGSDNIIRIIPDSNVIDPGYLFAFLNSYYGYNLIIQIRFGALQDALDTNYISKILIPITKTENQKKIGDLVRKAYDLRAEAIRLEDEAQDILTKELTGK